jgi:hypothetical protein
MDGVAGTSRSPRRRWVDSYCRSGRATAVASSSSHRRCPSNPRCRRRQSLQCCPLCRSRPLTRHRRRCRRYCRKTRRWTRRRWTRRPFLRLRCLRSRSCSRTPRTRCAVLFADLNALSAGAAGESPSDRRARTRSGPPASSLTCMQRQTRARASRASTESASRAS